jgi:hypothetical protein
MQEMRLLPTEKRSIDQLVLYRTVIPLPLHFSFSAPLMECFLLDENKKIRKQARRRCIDDEYLCRVPHSGKRGDGKRWHFSDGLLQYGGIVKKPCNSLLFRPRAADRSIWKRRPPPPLHRTKKRNRSHRSLLFPRQRPACRNGCIMPNRRFSQSRIPLPAHGLLPGRSTGPLPGRT